MSPEQAERPSPPVAGWRPATTGPRPVSSLQVTASAFKVNEAEAPSSRYLALIGAWRGPGVSESIGPPPAPAQSLGMLLPDKEDASRRGIVEGRDGHVHRQREDRRRAARHPLAQVDRGEVGVVVDHHVGLGVADVLHVMAEPLGREGDVLGAAGESGRRRPCRQRSSCGCCRDINEQPLVGIRGASGARGIRRWRCGSGRRTWSTTSGSRGACARGWSRWRIGGPAPLQAEFVDRLGLAGGGLGGLGRLPVIGGSQSRPSATSLARTPARRWLRPRPRSHSDD